MARRQDILRLFELGFSQRRIARKLNVHRETVSRYIRQAQSEAKPANVPTGCEAGDGSKPANVPAGSEGRNSQCQPFQQVIQDKRRAGLSAQRIWQDLRAEHGFCGAYREFTSYRVVAGRNSGSNPRRATSKPLFPTFS